MFLHGEVQINGWLVESGWGEWIYSLFISSAELEAVKLTLALRLASVSSKSQSWKLWGSAKGRSAFFVTRAESIVQFHLNGILLNLSRALVVTLSKGWLDIIVWLCFWHCIWTLFLTFQFHSQIAWQQRNVPALLFLFCRESWIWNKINLKQLYNNWIEHKTLKL